MSLAPSSKRGLGRFLTVLTLSLSAIAPLACLYTEEIPTPPEYPEDLPPVIVNTSPPRNGRMIIPEEGQLFEVWVVDPNQSDRDLVTIDWQLERIGLRGRGSKLFLRPEDIPEVSDGRVTLEVRVQDAGGGQATASWTLSVDDDLGSL